MTIVLDEFGPPAVSSSYPTPLGGVRIIGDDVS